MTFTFDLDGLSWSKEPERVECTVSKTLFASGGFREAYKTTYKTKRLRESNGYSKEYLQTTNEMIKEMSETAESHTKKVVQMHHLAAHMAVNLSTAVKKANKQRLFGQMFQYQGIFMRKIEFVTIEEFIW